MFISYLSHYLGISYNLDGTASKQASKQAGTNLHGDDDDDDHHHLLMQSEIFFNHSNKIHSLQKQNARELMELACVHACVLAARCTAMLRHFSSFVAHWL